ncbi:MAG: hypothetical protein ACREM1_17860 [Longimicrobiales bacterium]
MTASQSAARKIYDAGFTGFRSWSSFFGEWHSVVLFLDRIRTSELQFGEPEHLAIQHPAFRSAAEALDMEFG